MPKATIVDIPMAEQARMVAELRRARYGHLLALHLLLLGKRLARAVIDGAGRDQNGADGQRNAASTGGA